MGLNRTLAVKASSAVGAAGGNSATFTNRDCSGITFIVKNTAATGTTPTLTVRLQEFATGAGWVDVPGAVTTALAGGTPATTLVTIYPGMTVTANAGVSRPLGKTWRLAWAIGGTATPTVTFSVDAELHA